MIAQMVVILSDKLISSAFRCQSNTQKTINDSNTPNMIAHANNIHNMSINH